MLVSCSNCSKQIDENVKYCQYCGKKNVLLHEELATGHKIRIYFFSAILAPFGLYWFFKYFKNQNEGNRKVAYISLVITLVSLIISIFIVFYYVKTVSRYTDQYKHNIEIYKDLAS